MAQIDSDPNRLLYHGTLRRNVPSIRDTGLLPQRGAWTARFHPDAASLVYAVDDDDFKNDMVEHGAIIVVKATTFRCYPWAVESGHPTGAEPGNWYRLEPVSVENEMIGKAMLAWLEPSEQDFIHRYREHMRGKHETASTAR